MKAIGQIFGGVGDDHGGGGVEEGDVALGAGVALKDGLQGGGGFGRGLDLQVGEASVVDSQIFWVEGPGMDVAVVQLADAGGAEGGDFVEAVFGVNDPGAGAADFAEDGGEAVGQFGGEYAEQLIFGAAGVGEGAEEVEDRGDGEGGAGGGDVLHGRVMSACEGEADVSAVEAAAQIGGCCLEIQA